MGGGMDEMMSNRFAFSVCMLYVLSIHEPKFTTPQGACRAFETMINRLQCFEIFGQSKNHDNELYLLDINCN